MLLNANDLRHKFPALPELQHRDGWLPLVDRLMELILKAGFDPQHHRVLQVKEKLGTLRFYVDLKDMPNKQHAVIEQLIAAAICQSSTLCEVCGHPGHAHTHMAHRQTLCHLHANPLQFYSPDRSHENLP